MKFKIIRTLIKEENTIRETFIIDKKNPAFIDQSKKISKKIQDLFSKYSIGELFTLIESKDIDYGRINIYIYSDKVIPDLYKEFYFIYIGNLGQKKCDYCDYSILLKNNKKACWVKGKYIDKHSHYKCQYYYEKAEEKLLKL